MVGWAQPLHVTQRLPPTAALNTRCFHACRTSAATVPVSSHLDETGGFNDTPASHYPRLTASSQNANPRHLTPFAPVSPLPRPNLTVALAVSP